MRSKKFVVSMLVCLLIVGAQAATVFTFDYTGNGDLDAAGGRRYTTFGTGANHFDAATGALIGGELGTTNSNTGVNNPGPGFFYIPTGVAWQADTTYTIDFLVADRGGQADNGVLEFGLWAGLPSNDTGAGAYSFNDGSTTVSSFNASSDASLGQIGQITIASSVLANGQSTFVSDLMGTTATDTVFSFTTGSDVSGMGDMVFFLRAGDDGLPSGKRTHWDLIEVNAIPEPTTLILLGSGFAGIMMRRRK